MKQRSRAATSDPPKSADGGRCLYYGWVVVGASVLLMAGILGTQLCFGVFLPVLREEFGWSSAAASGAMSLSLGVGGVVGIMVGRFSDRCSMWAVVAAGTFFGAGSYALLTITSSLWHLYLFFGVGIGISAGCIYAPVIANVSKWFSGKRLLAIGLTMAGIMMGKMALPPLISHILGEDGEHWRAGYWTLAGIVLFTGILGGLLTSKKPPVAGSGDVKGAHKHAPSGMTKEFTVREAAKTAPFWMLMITGFAVAFNFYFVVAHIVTCGLDSGLARQSAALILTISGVGSVVGTIAAHWMAAKLGGRRTLLALCLSTSVPVFLFIPAASDWYFYLVAAFFGFFFGAVGPVRMSLIPPLFGLKSVGAILGWATFFWSMGGIVGPYLAGFIHDVTERGSADMVGSYDIAFVVGGILLLIAAASVYFWGEHKRGRDRVAASEGGVG